jgi:hypothetical protein
MTPSKKGILKMGGTTNCKGYFHFIFPNHENLNVNLTNLSQKKIATYNLQTTGNEKRSSHSGRKTRRQLLKLTKCVLAELEKLRVDTWKPKQ